MARIQKLALILVSTSKHFSGMQDVKLWQSRLQIRSKVGVVRPGQSGLAFRLKGVVVVFGVVLVIIVVLRVLNLGQGVTKFVKLGRNIQIWRGEGWS